VECGVRAPLTHGSVERKSQEKELRMLWTIFVILLVLWALGMVSAYTLGGYIHILLVIALAVILINVIQGRRPVA
jgi:fatty acid desaturase